MENITCIIIDDENPARKLVNTFLLKKEKVEVLGEASNGFEAVKLIDQLKPDLIFLDIQMPKLNGFEVLELIHHKPKVIFTTAYDQYALKAFEENAVDYLLKPFSFDRISKSIDRVLSSKKNHVELPKINNDLKRIVVKNGTEINIIYLDEIYSITSNDDYVIIKTKKGEFVKNQTMNFYENNLPSDTFIRVHRSSIININLIKKLNHVAKENYEIELLNGDKVKVSKANIKKVKELLS